MYNCKRCGSEWEFKYLLKRHLARKTLCNPVLSDIDRVKLISEFQLEQKEKKYICKHCKKCFTNKNSKYVHQRDCKGTVNDTINDLTEQIVILKEELKKIHSSQTINNNNIKNTQNININLTLRDFASDENKKYLDPEVLLECFRDQDLLKVLQELHFNPDHPENHNVRVKNVKQNLMEYTEGGKWMVGKKDDVLRHLILNGYRVLHTYYKENKEDVCDELDDEEIDDSISWLSKIYNEDKMLMKELKDDAFLLVMNNKALLMGK
jgi:hypothetical protein